MPEYNPHVLAIFIGINNCLLSLPSVFSTPCPVSLSCSRNTKISLKKCCQLPSLALAVWDKCEHDQFLWGLRNWLWIYYLIGWQWPMETLQPHHSLSHLHCDLNGIAYRAGVRQEGSGNELKHKGIIRSQSTPELNLGTPKFTLTVQLINTHLSFSFGLPHGRASLNSNMLMGNGILLCFITFYQLWMSTEI